ncbi:Ldh family oxidoreductase [Jeotgalibacillus soli]|uniref:Malate dehydrogenase n=1 Tax=Jeotgalibacillus soli TaxID=889306 RepID=A0A0C2RPE5_9BACL|nr:Ldh family oxidoreductase [Jeotgalibacillus soli]KIL52130.1 malate dehydrogenase [Jeotgalibacillus soli]
MSKVIVDVGKLRAFCTNVLAQSIPKEEAAIVADNLVEADLLGISSHGVCKVADYLKRMEDGLIERKTEILYTSKTKTTALYDASNGWGQVVSVKAMEKVIDMALEYGTGFVGVKNSNHFGITSYYTKMAAERGCIGIATTNASGLMVPFGSREPSLGTNPISIAVPAGPGKEPVVLDMSTGNTARGKITLAQKTGGTIPEDWAITKDGNPTIDPREALEGYLLPMGAKGSGLAIMVDILSGVLTGALFGSSVPRMYEDKKPQNLGHSFAAISIEAFVEITEFYERMDRKIAETVNSQPMAGFDRVYMPGEVEAEKKRLYVENGVPLSYEIYEELKKTGEKYSVSITDYLSVERIKMGGCTNGL